MKNADRKKLNNFTTRLGFAVGYSPPQGIEMMSRRMSLANGGPKKGWKWRDVKVYRDGLDRDRMYLSCVGLNVPLNVLLPR
jgi:hypothetical protein